MMTFEQYLINRDLPYKRIRNQITINDLLYIDIENVIMYFPDVVYVFGDVQIPYQNILELPDVLHVEGTFDISYTCENINIKFGTFVGQRLFSYDSKYSHLEYVYINGYFTTGGILS